MIRSILLRFLRFATVENTIDSNDNNISINDNQTNYNLDEDTGLFLNYENNEYYNTPEDDKSFLNENNFFDDIDSYNNDLSDEN